MKIEKQKQAGAAPTADMKNFLFLSTELQKERELRERMLNRIQDIVYVLDMQKNRLEFISSEIALLLGYPWRHIQQWGDNLFPTLMHPEDLALRPFFHARLSTVRDGEQLDIQYRMRDARGEWRWLRSREAVLERAESGAPVRVLGIAEDFTSHKRDEDRLREMALVDDLTGLRNRRGFLAIAEQYTRIARRQGQRFCLLFIDVDRFKAINDAYGHAEGDRALRAAGAVLQKTFRNSDIFCRYGGDEFAALAVDTAEQGSEILRSRIRKNLDECNTAAAKPYRLDFSIGIFIFDPSRRDTDASDANLFEEAIRMADEAMYRDKIARRSAGGGAAPHTVAG